MPPLSEAFLPQTDVCQVRTHTAARALAVVASLAVGLLSAVGLFYAGQEFGRSTPHNHAAYGVSLNAFNSSWTNNLKAATALAAGLNADCYTFTGGTCHVAACDPSRHAECISGKCMCVSSCTGVDGVCYQGTYPVVASGFTLTNKKYSWQKMYFPSTAILDQLKVSMGMFISSKDKFILRQLPGTMAGKKDYFLTCEYYPEYVAAIRSTAGTAFSLFGAYEVGLYKEFSPDRLAVKVCSKGDGQIMIGSPGKVNTEWFYIHHGSWNVYGSPSSDPGDGAIWITNPPIPDGLLPLCDNN